MLQKQMRDTLIPQSPSRRLARSTTRANAVGDKSSKHVLSLALQGGGSFGAFTWGVLDRILEEDAVEIDSISGTSAGAINAVLLADGLAQGSRKKARQKLDGFWRRVSNSRGNSLLGKATDESLMVAAMEVSTQMVSPYQFNPLGIDPLRILLEKEIDFERLRAKSPVHLIVAATRIKDGRERLFQEDDISLDAVLASACLPLLQQAVEIEGEWYWDGGYTSNPPLRRLALDTRANDILLVQIIPEEHDAVPRSSSDITRRIRQITFNVPLRREIESLSDLQDLCRSQRLCRSKLCRKLLQLKLHQISAERSVKEQSHENAFNLDWQFLLYLKSRGRTAAETWLSSVWAKNLSDDSKQRSVA